MNKWSSRLLVTETCKHNPNIDTNFDSLNSHWWLTQWCCVIPAFPRNNFAIYTLHTFWLFLPLKDKSHSRLLEITDGQRWASFPCDSSDKALDVPWIARGSFQPKRFQQILKASRQTARSRGTACQTQIPGHGPANSWHRFWDRLVGIET